MPRDLSTGELDRAGFRWCNADQRLEQCRFARAVAAEQCDNLVLGDIERDRVEDMAFAIERIDVVDAEQSRCARSGWRRLGGNVRGARTDIDLAHLGIV